MGGCATVSWLRFWRGERFEAFPCQGIRNFLFTVVVVVVVVVIYFFSILFWCRSNSSKEL